MRTRLPVLVVLLAIAAAAVAAVLPGATIRITPVSTAVGPIQYQLSAAIAGHQSAHLTTTQDGTATGERLDEIPATGTVVFSNWNTVAVAVPAGTKVSVQGGPAFTTDKRIVVPRGKFNGGSINPGRGSVSVTAAAGGPAGNVDAGAINTVDDASVRTFLRGFPDNPNRLVTNSNATTGGSETKHAVIQQTDVDALVAAITAELQQHLAEALAGHSDWIYQGPPADEKVVVEIPPDLVGKEDTATFTLTGTLDFNRAYVMRSDIEQPARTRLLADTTAVPAGKAVVADSIAMEVGAVTMAADKLQVEVSMRAAAAAAIDESAVRDRVAGMSSSEAEAALAPLGKVKVDFWPGWVDHIPRLGFRISVVTVAQAGSGS